MLAAAVATGVSATFGAPIGGVLFSIEVSATYYMVSNLWKAFFCATCGVLMYKFLEVFETVEPFHPTTFSAIAIDHEIFFYALLGILCGILGALFVHVLTKIIFLRARLKLPFISHRWKWCFTIALIVGLVSYPI
jgi:chloride channel 2